MNKDCNCTIQSHPDYERVRKVWDDSLKICEGYCREAEAKLAEMREALIPLARVAGEMEGQFEQLLPDGSSVPTGYLTLGQARAARAALVTVPPPAARGEKTDGSAGQQTWQPIETCPKRRKVIAGFRNPLGNWRSVMARYYPAGTLEADESLDEDQVDENGFAPEGWYEESETYDIILPISPTHWMPLPAPPAASPVPVSGSDHA